MLKKKAAATDEKLRIEYMTLEELQGYPENPKNHDSENIAASYNRFGFNDPFAIDESTGYLAEGHGRLESLSQDHTNGKEPPKHVVVKEDGSWTVPVIRGVSFSSERELRAYIIAHNRITESGGWDESKLATILKDAQEFGSLDGIGWTGRQLESFIESLESGDADSPNDDNGKPARSGAKQAAMVSNTMRQIVLYYDVADYEWILDKLQALMTAEGFDSHSDAVRYMLEMYSVQTKN